MAVADADGDVRALDAEGFVEAVGAGLLKGPRGRQRLDFGVAEGLVEGQRPIKVADVHADVGHGDQVHVPIRVAMGRGGLHQLVEHPFGVAEENEPVARYAVGFGKELHALRLKESEVGA